MTAQAHSIGWQVRVARLAYTFFSFENNEAKSLAVGKQYTPGQLTPLDGGDFIKYLEQQTEYRDQYDNAADIDRILRRMADEGILGIHSNLSPMPILGVAYTLMRYVTQSQKAGLMWLSPILGPRFLVPSIASATIAITGTIKVEGGSERDPHVGTGIALDATHILTCAHNITDMDLDEQLMTPPWIAPYEPLDDRLNEPLTYTVADTYVHPDVDVAVIGVEPTKTGLPYVHGLALRDPEWVDRVYVTGYPPVPQRRDDAATAHAGEVVQPGITTYDGKDLFLFSAIARPGNSGGPIVGADGRLLGVVTREVSDQAATANTPFYCGVPTRVVHQALNDFGLSDLLPIETWDR